MKKKKLFAINFSSKQKGEVTNHRTVKDKEENPLKMCKVYIPSKDYRPQDISFGIDSNGIDRDDRTAYINLPNNAVFNDKNREGRMFTYLDEKRDYKIHFVGKPTGEQPTLDGKVPFDKPETVTVSAEQLMKLYSNGSINREKNNKSIENQTEAKVKSKEQKKEVKKDIVER